MDRSLPVTGIAQPTALCIHGPLQECGIACVAYTHRPYATALTQLDDMMVEMTGQTATGRPCRDVDPAIVERTAGHFRAVATVGENTHTAIHVAALKRLLDRVNPGYAN